MKSDTSDAQLDTAAQREASELAVSRLDPMRYELLANYLRPLLGNIYEYNLNGGDPLFDYQEWTDDLKDAVRHYLLQGLPPDVGEWLLGADGTNGNREARVESLLELQPCEVALMVRHAAVSVVPELDQLIGYFDAWSSEDEHWNALIWLEAHLPVEQWPELIAAAARHDDEKREPATKDLDAAVEALSPAELIDSWRFVAGPAVTDLTDEEWSLIAPFIPRGPGVSNESAIRQAVNGMVWRHVHATPGLSMPARYGYGHSISDRKYYYKKFGVFDRMLVALDVNPDAARLVEWLRSVVKRGRRRRVAENAWN